MTKLKSFFATIKKEFWRQPVLYAFLGVLIAAGAWLRLYKISDTLMFQGDQGRDAIVVARMFREWDPAFIGPVTSIGNMYLGPFYYYFMLPWLWISYPNPVGPAIGVALANVVAIILTYVLGKKMVGERAALWASVLFTFSQVAIFYGRFSWNPNLSALVSLLTIFFIHQALTEKTKNWLWVGLCAGILIQLHYVNLVVVAVAGIFWLWQWWKKGREKKWRQKNHFWQMSVGAVVIFFLTTTPLVLFDWKYDWRNIEAGVGIFTKEESFTSNQEVETAQSARALRQQLKNRTRQVLGDLAMPEVPKNEAFFVFTFLVLITFLYLTYKKRETKEALGYVILAVSVVMTIVITGLYRHNFYDHYLLFILPVIFLIYGCLLSQLRCLKQKWLKWAITILLMIFYLTANYRSGFYVGNNMPAKINEITDFIITQLPKQTPFAFSFVNDNKDSLGEHYRYFLETKTDQLVDLSEIAKAEVMFIVDETNQANIYDLSSFDVVVFRDDATVSAIPYNDVTIYKLEKKTEQAANDE